MSTDRNRDHTAAHRANVLQNRARIEAHLQVAQLHHRQIVAGIHRERDEVQKTIDHLQRTAGDPSQWSAEDRADLERALARRHQLDNILATERRE